MDCKHSKLEVMFAGRLICDVPTLTEEIRYPSIEQVLALYNSIVDVTGGERGTLSKSNLGYVLDTVRDVGERLPRRRAIVKKAAFLLYNVVVVHPFLNGNKRTAFGLMETFLGLNGTRFPQMSQKATNS